MWINNPFLKRVLYKYFLYKFFSLNSIVEVWVLLLFLIGRLVGRLLFGGLFVFFSNANCFILFNKLWIL